MKKAFHKAFSFLMALVFLFSTMSFTISSHYCGDNLVDSSIFLKLKTCDMVSNIQTDTALKSPDCSLTKKNCCSEQSDIFKGQDQLQFSFGKITLEQHLFVVAFFHGYHNIFKTSQEHTPSLDDYLPPNIVRLLYKLDKTYLI